MDHRAACHERQGLEDYLASYADISGDAIRNGIVDTDSDTTTQGPITDPEDRRAPIELRPWKDGADILGDIYDCLLAADDNAKFPSRLHVEETAYELATINCEAAVHLFDVDTVYKPAKRIVDTALQRPAALRTAISLFLRRRRYNSVSVFGEGDDGVGAHELVFSPHCRAASITAHRGQKRKRSRSATADTQSGRQGEAEHPSPAAEDVIQVSIGAEASSAAYPSALSNHRDTVKMPKIKSDPGDYYCSLVSKLSSKATLLIVGEAKAPHKLTRDLLHNALSSDDVIHVRQLIQCHQPDHEALPHLFAARPATIGAEVSQPREHEHEHEHEHEEQNRGDDQRWVAAVAAQLYTELLKRRMRYGYITTGESYLIVRIRPDQPAVLEYMLLPIVEPQPADAPNREKWLAATPLARLSCLVLLSLFGDGSLSAEEIRQAIATSLIWQSPRHRVESLGPKSFASASGLANESDADWKAPDRSSSGHEDDTHDHPHVQPHKRNCPSNEDFVDHGGPRKRLCHTVPTIPSPEVSVSPAAAMEREWVPRTLPTCSAKEQDPRRRQYPTPPPESTELQAISFCTSRCILSLISRGKLPADPACANRVLHQKHASTTTEVLDLVRTSITLPNYHQSFDLNTGDASPSVRRPTPNAAYMGTYGAASLLFKVRVQPGGYVLVAKGARSIYPRTDADMVERLRREARAYERLRVLQGQSVPVCAGLVDLSKDVPRQTYESLSMLGQDWHCPAFLLLSWAGDGLLCHHPRPDKTAEQVWLRQVRADMAGVLRQVHNLGMLQGDAAMRNFVVTPASELQSNAEDSEGQGQRNETGKPSSVLLVDFERSVSESRFKRQLSNRLPTGQAITKDRLAALFQRACEREREDCLQQFDDWAAKRIRRLGSDDKTGPAYDCWTVSR